MAPETIRALILSFYLHAGYQDFQAEAMVRQAFIESRFQHCVIAGSGSEGLYQWAGSRRRQLHEFGGTGCVPLEKQLAFANYELRGQARYRSFWRASRDTAFAVLRACFGRGRC